MENVTFVSNSHQRPAADNLQKLKSLLTNTRQQIKSQTQQVTIKNLYVSSFTLVCFRSGKLTISNNHDTIYCDEPGMLVLKKEQVVNVTLEEVNGHMDFDILEIPTQRLGALYALIPNEQQTKMAAAKLLRIGNHNVNAVALKCGYDSTSYFIQCFKKYFKTTPSTFIKMANH